MFDLKMPKFEKIPFQRTIALEKRLKTRKVTEEIKWSKSGTFFSRNVDFPLGYRTDLRETALKNWL